MTSGYQNQVITFDALKRKSPTSSSARKDSDEENLPVQPLCSSKSPCSDRTNNGLSTTPTVAYNRDNGTNVNEPPVKHMNGGGSECAIITNGTDKVTISLVNDSNDGEDDYEPPPTVKAREVQDPPVIKAVKPQRKSAANNTAVRLNQTKREEKLINNELKKRAALDNNIEPAVTELIDSKKMRMDDGVVVLDDDNDDDVIIVDPASSGRSPRKSARSTPAKSYKEVDSSLYEERRPKTAKNRSLEKFKEFFKAAAERSKTKPDAVEVLPRPQKEAKPAKEPKQPREPKEPKPPREPKKRGPKPKYPRPSMEQLNSLFQLQQNGLAAALGISLPPSIASALSISVVPSNPTSSNHNPLPPHQFIPAANHPFFQANPFASLFPTNAVSHLVPPSGPQAPRIGDGLQPGAGLTPKRRGRKPVILTEEEREARKQAYKRKLAEKLKEKRRLEREAKEQAKALHDDLSIPNLKALPTLPEFNCKIPSEGLGDLMCILEFMSAYSSELGVKDYFPQGVSFDILERAFTENDPMGLLVNVVQILLGCIVRLQDKDWTIDYNVKHDNDESDKSVIQAQEKAAAAGREFRDTFGFMFHTAPLDSFTYSDMLRWHLKASGAPGVDLRDRIHCHQGFTPKEDPGFKFVCENPDVMEKLERGSIAGLNVLEKIKVVRCLVDQLLTLELFRETIEDGLDRCVELKVQLKKLLWRKKLLEDEEKGIKKEKGGNNPTEEGEDSKNTEEVRKTNEDEKKRKNWRYDLPEMPRRELEQRITTTETQINKVWYRFGLSCLGEDRAHRIYNVMHSVPAIVVETLACVEAPCIEGGTPAPSSKESVVENGPTSAAHGSHPTENGTAKSVNAKPEINEIKGSASSSPTKSVSGSPQKSTVKTEGGADAEEKKIEVPVDDTLVCSGNMETCRVHADQQPRYYFIQNHQQLEALVNALAPKGLRETVLKETITNEMDYLRNVIKRTPISKLNRTMRDTYRRKYPSEALKSSNVLGLEANVALDLTFRELLLDIEDKAVQASLGGFKAESGRRQSWRAELDEPLIRMQKLTPEQTNKIMKVDEHEVKRMAERLLEFAETVPARFLNGPLGEQVDENTPAKMENWKAALPNCTNFSQLFLFYSALEASIQWQKGLIQARCKVCRGKPTPERMVRCDRCDQIFHLSCLKPALRDVPEETWFCKNCEPDTVLESPLKKQRTNGTAASAEPEAAPPAEKPVIENNEYCDVCRRDEKLLLCDFCPRSFHLECLDIKRAPRGDWRCIACCLEPKKYRQELKELRKRVLDKEAAEVDVQLDLNQCAKCGELLSRGHIDCKGCARKFHLICADLPKRPKGDWYCRKKCEPGYVPNESLSQILLLDDESMDEKESVAEEEEVVEAMEEEEVVDAEKSFAEADAYDYKACSDILDVLKKSDHAWPFLTPVTKKDAPDYHRIIKKPMDFGTVQTKLNDSKYTRNSEFVSDVMQVFINCEQYNMEEAEVYREGKQLLELFVDLLDNYSMAPLLDTQQFKWLDDYINNRCPKCQQEFADGAKTVTCKGCSSTFHPKCAGVKGSTAKWTCSNCTQMVENEEEPAEKTVCEEDEQQMEEDNPEPIDVHGFDYKACTDLLNYLLKDSLSFAFRKPVTKKDAPDYFEIIAQPMDLSTIQNSLNNMGYKSNRDVIFDIVLMFDNCERYNHEASDIYADAYALWEKLLRWLTRRGLEVLLEKTPDWKITKGARRSKSNS
ncbi:tyrosine-protein kinase BAZ1B-like isoform X3 [Varroa destructor]|uniref:Bromodomain adjacent to zinc finger domain protein 1A n=1 Tax=Varroa destructor TaxID=109461 RepID=A0A7M7JIK9_VARDE|nr:tyrosine-protein kinase BAZ1B-like isoform X3 [Varroa destructor]